MAACYDNSLNGNHHIQEVTCIKSCLHFTIIHIKLNYLNILLKYIVGAVLSLLHMFVERGVLRDHGETRNPCGQKCRASQQEIKFIFFDNRGDTR